MMTKEESTKFVNFMTPGAGVLIIARGHICHYYEYALRVNIEHIDCYCIKGI